MKALRGIAVAAAMAAMGFATWTWAASGAWHYGAMPTVGMIRVNLLGLGALICFAAAGFLARHR